MDDNDKLVDNVYKLRQKLTKGGTIIGNIDICEKHLEMCVENGAKRIDTAKFADNYPLRQVYMFMGFSIMCDPFEECPICSIEKC